MSEYVVVPGYLGGPWEDLVSVLTPIAESTVQAGQGVVSDTGGQALNELLKSTQFKQVLDQVEAKARKGAEDVIKKEFFRLGLFAAASGAIGGTILRGTVGNAVALGLAVYAAWPYVSSGVAEQKKK